MLTGWVGAELLSHVQLHLVADEEARRLAGATDARLFRDVGIPTVVRGGAGRGFHGADEHVPVDSLLTLARAYLEIAAHFGG